MGLTSNILNIYLKYQLSENCSYFLMFSDNVFIGWCIPFASFYFPTHLSFPLDLLWNPYRSDAAANSSWLRLQGKASKQFPSQLNNRLWLPNDTWYFCLLGEAWGPVKWVPNPRLNWLFSHLLGWIFVEDKSIVDPFNHRNDAECFQKLWNELNETALSRERVAWRSADSRPSFRMVALMF